MRYRSRLVAAALLVIAGGCVITFAWHGTTPPDKGTFIPSNVGTRMPASRPTTPIDLPVDLPRSVPVRIAIPAIDVDAPIMEMGLNPDHTIQVPPLSDNDVAGWYRYGPSPGQQGAAVMLGHVDSDTGASVFFRLKYLRQGDKVDVALANGELAAFAVDGVQKVPKAHFPTADVYGAIPYPGLRLITCGGPFDTATRHYLDNIIVYAHLTPASTPSPGLGAGKTRVPGEVPAPGETRVPG